MTAAKIAPSSEMRVPGREERKSKTLPIRNNSKRTRECFSTPKGSISWEASDQEFISIRGESKKPPLPGWLFCVSHPCPCANPSMPAILIRSCGTALFQHPLTASSCPLRQRILVSRLASLYYQSCLSRSPLALAPSAGHQVATDESTLPDGTLHNVIESAAEAGFPGDP